MMPPSHEPDEENIVSRLEDVNFVEMMVAGIIKDVRNNEADPVFAEYIEEANNIVEFAVGNYLTPYIASKYMGYSPIDPMHQIIVGVAKLLYEDLEL